MDTTKLHVADLSDQEYIIVNGNPCAVIESTYEHTTAVAVVIYEDYDTGEHIKLSLPGEIKVEVKERLCANVSGASRDFPGDHCSNQAAPFSEFCSRH